MNGIEVSPHRSVANMGRDEFVPMAPLKPLATTTGMGASTTAAAPVPAWMKAPMVQNQNQTQFGQPQQQQQLQQQLPAPIPSSTFNPMGQSSMQFGPQPSLQSPSQIPQQAQFGSGPSTMGMGQMTSTMGQMYQPRQQLPGYPSTQMPMQNNNGQTFQPYQIQQPPSTFPLQPQQSQPSIPSNENLRKIAMILLDYASPEGSTFLNLAEMSMDQSFPSSTQNFEQDLIRQWANPETKSVAGVVGEKAKRADEPEFFADLYKSLRNRLQTNPTMFTDQATGKAVPILMVPLPSMRAYEFFHRLFETLLFYLTDSSGPKYEALVMLCRQATSELLRLQIPQNIRGWGPIAFDLCRLLEWRYQALLFDDQNTTVMSAEHAKDIQQTMTTKIQQAIYYRNLMNPNERDPRKRMEQQVIASIVQDLTAEVVSKAHFYVLQALAEKITLPMSLQNFFHNIFKYYDKKSLRLPEEQQNAILQQAAVALQQKQYATVERLWRENEGRQNVWLPSSYLYLKEMKGLAEQHYDNNATKAAAVAIEIKTFDEQMDTSAWDNLSSAQQQFVQDVGEGWFVKLYRLIKRHGRNPMFEPVRSIYTASKKTLRVLVLMAAVLKIIGHIFCWVKGFGRLQEAFSALVSLTGIPQLVSMASSLVVMIQTYPYLFLAFLGTMVVCWIFKTSILRFASKIAGLTGMNEQEAFEILELFTNMGILLDVVSLVVTVLYGPVGIIIGGFRLISGIVGYLFSFRSKLDVPVNLKYFTEKEVQMAQQLSGDQPALEKYILELGTKFGKTENFKIEVESTSGKFEVTAVVTRTDGLSVTKETIRGFDKPGDSPEQFKDELGQLGTNAKNCVALPTLTKLPKIDAQYLRDELLHVASTNTLFLRHSEQQYLSIPVEEFLKMDIATDFQKTLYSAQLADLQARFNPMDPNYKKETVIEQLTGVGAKVVVPKSWVIKRPTGAVDFEDRKTAENWVQQQHKLFVKMTDGTWLFDISDGKEFWQVACLRLFRSSFDATTILVNELCLQKDVPTLLRAFCQVLTVQKYVTGYVYGAAAHGKAWASSGANMASGAASSAWKSFMEWYTRGKTS